MYCGEHVIIELVFSIQLVTRVSPSYKMSETFKDEAFDQPLSRNSVQQRFSSHSLNCQSKLGWASSSLQSADLNWVQPNCYGYVGLIKPKFVGIHIFLILIAWSLMPTQLQKQPSLMIFSSFNLISVNNN